MRSEQRTDQSWLVEQLRWWSRELDWYAHLLEGHPLPADRKCTDPRCQFWPPEMTSGFATRILEGLSQAKSGSGKEKKTTESNRFVGSIQSAADGWVHAVEFDDDGNPLFACALAPDRTPRQEETPLSAAAECAKFLFEGGRPPSAPRLPLETYARLVQLWRGEAASPSDDGPKRVRKWEAIREALQQLGLSPPRDLDTLKKQWRANKRTKRATRRS